MLKLKNICKSYNIGKNKKVVLDDINLEFKDSELVFITGVSGTGKSTLLNIIGGFLKCDSGEIYFNDKLVSSFNERELDLYRMNIVGNIFQDYNLIDYMSVLDNILLGCSSKVDDELVVLLLKQLGIYDKRRYIVNKLSGGERQRVAIARSLINNPQIVLADEPTGALDYDNGIEIMEVLKKISKNKLVIVVSHDNFLADKYADRIIKIVDGKCNTLPVSLDNKNKEYNFKRKRINIFRIIKLAIRNLWLKKFRTFIMSFAISLGIISMLLVICLYNGFNNEINNLEEDVVSLFPITVSNGNFEILDSKINSSKDKIIIKNREDFIHTNKINREYINYLNNIKEIKNIIYDYNISMPVISDSYKSINDDYLSVIGVDNNYEIIYGREIENDNEVLLKVDSNNNVSSDILNSFNIDDDIDYNIIVGRKMKVILNDLYYVKNGDYYYINNDNVRMYNNSNLTLVIVGIVREKEIINDNSMILYNNDLLDKLFDLNKESKIVSSQKNSSYNVLGIDMDKDMMLSYLGYNTLPSNISIYVSDIKDKDSVILKLDEYNKNNDRLIYVDTMADAIKIIKDLVLIISIILILFSMIAIFISSLMVGLLTNMRILERKREIGILKSLGFSKRNIKSLFNIENFIISILSFGLGILFVIFIRGFINSWIYNLLEIDNIFIIRIEILFLVLIFNLFLVWVASVIPVKKASKLDIVDCIYNR